MTEEFPPIEAYLDVDEMKGAKRSPTGKRARNIKAESTAAFKRQRELVRKLVEDHGLFFNVVRNQLYGKNGKPMDDRDIGTLWVNNCAPEIKSVQKLEEFLNSDLVPSKDPIKECLKSYAPIQDSILTLAESLHHIGHEPFDALFQWFISAAETALYHTPPQGVFVLYGPQKAGKTTWIRRLVPEELADYYSEAPLSSADNKDNIFALTDNFLVNLEELGTLNSQKELSQLKGLVTHGSINARRPYARRTICCPRRASLMASTNENSFLTDTTGNSRWWVFEVSGVDLPSQELVKGAWGEAVQAAELAHSEGKTVHPDGEICARLSRNAENFEVVGHIEEAIGIMFSPVPMFEGDIPDYISSVEMAEKIHHRYPNIDVNSKIQGRALGRLGFKKERKNFGRVYEIYPKIDK